MAMLQFPFAMKDNRNYEINLESEGEEKIKSRNETKTHVCHHQRRDYLKGAEEKEERMRREKKGEERKSRGEEEEQGRREIQA